MGFLHEAGREAPLPRSREDGKKREEKLKVEGFLFRSKPHGHLEQYKQWGKTSLCSSFPPFVAL